MKVVHIQYSMTPAGNAAYRLHQAMRREGIDSQMLCLKEAPRREHSQIVPETPSLQIRNAVNALWRKVRKYGLRPGSYFYSNLPLVGNGVANHPLVKSADAIYLHWIAGGSTAMSDIAAMAQTGKPVIIFMHDMWPLTGGCHHSFDCTQYQDGCTHCPMFSCNAGCAHQQLMRKQAVYSQYPNIHFVAPGQWLYERAQRALPLQGSSIHRIPNLLDENIFCRMDKAVAREKLNLPKDKTLVSFGCTGGTRNPFKGWSYLRDAINATSLSNVEIIIYGSGYSEQTEREIKYPIHFLGRLDDESQLSLVCNASDLYVTPSLAENYSLAVAENLVVGTPVVAFDNTGNAELVQTGLTGYLAKYRDTDDLRRGIETMIQHPITVQGWENFRAKNIVDMHLKMIDNL